MVCLRPLTLAIADNTIDDLIRHYFHLYAATGVIVAIATANSQYVIIYH